MMIDIYSQLKSIYGEEYFLDQDRSMINFNLGSMKISTLEDYLEVFKKNITQHEKISANYSFYEERYNDEFNQWVERVNKQIQESGYSNPMIIYNMIGNRDRNNIVGMESYLVGLNGNGKIPSVEMVPLVNTPSIKLIGNMTLISNGQGARIQQYRHIDTVYTISQPNDLVEKTNNSINVYDSETVYYFSKQGIKFPTLSSMSSYMEFLKPDVSICCVNDSDVPSIDIYYKDSLISKRNVESDNDVYVQLETAHQTLNVEETFHNKHTM